MPPDSLTAERLAELREWAEKAQRRGSSAFVPLPPRRLLALLDTIDAQAAVIERYGSGWRPTDAGPRFWWSPFDPNRNRYEPMTPAEQQVVYGEVVRPGTDQEATP